jgi:hypothetical protein
MSIWASFWNLAHASQTVSAGAYALTLTPGSGATYGTETDSSSPFSVNGATGAVTTTITVTDTPQPFTSL